MYNKDKSSEIGKWLSQFFGLPFLPPDETVDSFVEEMIPEAPTNERCSKFSNLVVCICFNTSMNTYIHGCAE
jgi:hypothetical protein